ncbi:MAG: acyl-ACP--UDP-N-acetylglucosamine O-acyltransferase [Alistipes sp.]|nr:acyl-ACP--UDP-N-acetylglucosamine O-acyltransferase [Candidatus Minthomonas equi]
MNSTAYSQVHPNAKIAAGVEIGPFCYIAENVEIGEGTVIGPHVTIFDYVKIGKNCNIFPGAVLGAIPQDLKFRGEESWVEIGDRTTIRECATVNRGTAASGKSLTKIGDDCLLMSYSHTAHDCLIGNHVILVSYVGLAGETQVDDWAIIGGASAAHQFSHIGAHAMLSGGSLISKDVPPYALAGHRPLSYVNVNIVGLRRRGFSNDQIERIRDIYRIIYQSGLNRTDACILAEKEVPACPEKQLILDFVRNSKRGIIRYSGDSSED